MKTPSRRVEYLAYRLHLANANATSCAGRGIAQRAVFKHANDKKMQHDFAWHVFAAPVHVEDSRLLGVNAIGTMQVAQKPVIARGNDFPGSVCDDCPVPHFHVGLARELHPHRNYVLTRRFAHIAARRTLPRSRAAPKIVCRVACKDLAENRTRLQCAYIYDGINSAET